LTSLSGRLSGGAQGIGASTVTQLYTSGAHVFFGDWDEKKGSKLAEELRGSTSTSGGSVTYLKVNIREYQSLLSLFDAAYNTHGRVDLAICCAAVTERPGYWEPELLNLETVREVSMNALFACGIYHAPTCAVLWTGFAARFHMCILGINR
jgi:NAD(P)-dependent dehydrogenase (short-subunit alcohol dehydrogenase family)